LIIGYGNSLRQDDGAGLKLAELLTLACHRAKVQATQRQVQQLTPELVLDIARPDVQAVIFADTRTMASDTDLWVQIKPLPMNEKPNDNTGVVGHYLAPETLLLFASMLYGGQPPSWLATVPGSHFGHGETMSETTRLALASSCDPIQKWLKQISALHRI
jgi:hydrogenase maturation protease